MPEISAHTAPAPPAAKPVAVAGAPAAAEDTANNQPFDGVLQQHLGDKQETKPVDAESGPVASDAGPPPVLAADGKDLPPDIAALIAASQPPAAAPAVAATAGNAAPGGAAPGGVVLDTVGDEAGAALARSPLPAALAALRPNDRDGLRGPATTTDAKVVVASKGAGATAAQTPPLSGLGALLSGGASFGTELSGASVLAQAASVKDLQGVSAKDIAALLADARSVTAPAPTTTTLTPAASTTSSTTTTPPAPPSTPLPFAQPGWEQGVGNRVMWMVNQQVQTAELRMNPAHLGPLEVRISIRDDQATVSFVSAHGQVRDALQAAIPHLREMLNDNGLTLSNVDIGQHSFADTRQRPDDAQARAGSGREGAGAVESTTEILSSVGRLGLIDDYA